MRRGFTLLELSIVLVIVGLIVGGITAGSSLIRNAELSNVVKNVASYNAATNGFRGKYASLPGDFAQAHLHWPDCVAFGSILGPWNCQGNGDGRIEGGMENPRVWQHLSTSGFLNGHYTYNIFATPAAQRAPKTPFASSYWEANYVTSVTDHDENEIPIGRHVFYFNLYGDTPGSELQSIDAKMDDGKALSGAVFLDPQGVDGVCLSSGAYDVSDALETYNCNLMFAFQ